MKNQESIPFDSSILSENKGFNKSSQGKDSSSNDNFRISEFTEHLGEKNSKGKYKCPNCQEFTLSIDKNGIKYDCYSCHETGKIASQLRQLDRNKDPKKYIDSDKEFHSKNNYNGNAKKSQSKPKNNNSKTVTQETNSIDDNKSTLERLRDKFPSMAWNELDLEIEYHDGKNKYKFEDYFAEIDTAYLKLKEQHPDQFNVPKGFKLSKNECIDGLIHLAKENKYHPVRDMLEDCLLRCDKIAINSLAKDYLRLDNPLYDEMLQKWLLAAVARVFVPGCYFRNILVLTGSQNIGKTSFFKILAGNQDFFSSSISDGKGKDELLIAHKNWILEYGEIEGLNKKKDLADVKRFISENVDTFRPPYGKAAKSHPRQFILCGTTNETEFLTDSTGNERFWVIPLGDKKVNLSKLEKDVQGLLANATYLVKQELAENGNKNIKSGKFMQLSPESYIQAQEENKNHLESHPYEDVIDKVIEKWGNAQCSKSGKFWIDPEKIWQELDIEKKEQPRHYKKVGQLMRQRGWESKFLRPNGNERDKYWIKKENIF